MTVATAEFEYLQDLVFKRSAIVLSMEKQYLLESRLMPIAREMGVGSVGDVIVALRKPNSRPLEDKIVEAMTTNETLWMRDIHPFNALRKTILPELIARKSSSRQLSVWSAACSSGQEIYSLAMILEEDFPELHLWRVDLSGTDLSKEMVEKARNGLYSTLEMNRGLPIALLVRFFSQQGNAYKLNDALRSRVHFRQGNLSDPLPSYPKHDIIFLRNVLIYFDLPTKRRILTAMAGCLAPGGYLMLGTAETMLGICDLYVSEKANGATYYRLKENQ